MAAMNDALRCLLSRRSVSAKRLVPPGPDADEMAAIVAAALTAPNHGPVRPWRFMLVAEAAREALADVFVAAKRGRLPDLAPTLLERERDKALHAPTLLVVCARIDAAAAVPPSEQWAAVGAAIHGALLAAHALGYGAIMLSGEKTEDPLIRSALGLPDDESLVGFISIGRVAADLPAKTRPAVGDFLSVWHGPAATADPSLRPAGSTAANDQTTGEP